MRPVVAWWAEAWLKGEGEFPYGVPLSLLPLRLMFASAEGSTTAGPWSNSLFHPRLKRGRTNDGVKRDGLKALGDRRAWSIGLKVEVGC